MKPAHRFLALTALLHLLLPLPLWAGDGVPTAEEVRLAGGMPPVIPHPVSDADDAVKCLTCHQSGKGKAPVVSHPERKNCGQCHVRSVVNGKGKVKGQKKK